MKNQPVYCFSRETKFFYFFLLQTPKTIRKLFFLFYLFQTNTLIRIVNPPCITKKTKGKHMEILLISKFYFWSINIEWKLGKLSMTCKLVLFQLYSHGSVLLFFLLFWLLISDWKSFSICFVQIIFSKWFSGIFTFCWTEKTLCFLILTNL